MDQIVLNGKSYNYIVKRKAIGSIRLHLKSAKSFYISCPIFTPDYKLKRFIQANSSWIINNSQKLHVYPKILDIKQIRIIDKTYTLFISKASKDQFVINQDTQKIFIYTPTLSQRHLKVLFEKNLRLLASSIIKKQLKDLSSLHDFKYHRVTLRNQSSRFGSCSSKGNLNFNWQIIFFPYDKFIHILLHELVHLKIKNHSSLFWQKLSLYDPDWKSNNRWLKLHGARQFIIKP